MTKEEKLFQYCKKFIKKQKITCGESIYQVDRILEEAPVFLEGVCKIVGYEKFDEDDE